MRCISYGSALFGLKRILQQSYAPFEDSIFWGLRFSIDPLLKYRVVISHGLSFNDQRDDLHFDRANFRFPNHSRSHGDSYLPCMFPPDYASWVSSRKKSDRSGLPQTPEYFQTSTNSTLPVLLCCQIDSSRYLSCVTLNIAATWLPFE